MSNVLQRQKYVYFREDTGSFPNDGPALNYEKSNVVIDGRPLTRFGFSERRVEKSWSLRLAAKFVSFNKSEPVFDNNDDDDCNNLVGKFEYKGYVSNYFLP